MAHDPKATAALALHRFGLGPRPGQIASIASDPRGALLAELDKPGIGRVAGTGLMGSAEASRALFDYRAEQQARQIVAKREAEKREAERQQVVDAWKDRVGELVNGVVKRVERGAVIVARLDEEDRDQAVRLLLVLGVRRVGGDAARPPLVALGAVEMDGRRYEAGRMLVLGAAASRVRAVEQSSVMVLGGEPVGERFIHWNFVSSSQDRLAQAAADWKAGRMKLPDADDAEFIPLPDAPGQPAPALS